MSVQAAQRAYFGTLHSTYLHTNSTSNDEPAQKFKKLGKIGRMPRRRKELLGKIREI
jgi:hypothetical protein